ncbi:hypothetical protein PVBG_05474 [Plasmodium vivax Brazil I]|uniref:Variable surface protein Vir7-like protein n=1 Tax=Plasmodium vivax (strain Brazil I) TaxID=1033975 RepID=A0A0J9SSM7_PLAV1|nr:hypothetical protein PVBG_05474 [Plasmodium vivax Brazil I]
MKINLYDYNHDLYYQHRKCTKTIDIYYRNKKGNCDRVQFYNNTEFRLRDYKDLHDFSDKIMKALCYVYNESASSSFDKNICDYLYYWLSDIIVTHLKNKSLYIQILAMLYDVLYNNKGERICNKIDYKINENGIKKFKLIFDYSQDYNTYMTQLTQDNHKCTENYKDYLQKYVDSYNELKSECGRYDNSYNYCGNFKTYISNKDPIHLSTWIRKLEVTKEQTKEDSIGDEGHIPLQPTLTAGPGTEGQPRLSGAQSDSSSTELGIIAAPLNDPPTHITSKSITAVASTAGFLVPSFLMYKVISIISIII